MRHPIITALTLVVLCAPVLAAAESIPVRVPNANEVDCPLRLTPYALEYVDDALEAQAWVVMNAAHEYAVDNGGFYPATVDDFVAHLPRGERMENLLTGKRNVPSEMDPCPFGAILFRPIQDQGETIGCDVIVALMSGDALTLSSDGIWPRNQAPVIATSTPTR